MEEPLIIGYTVIGLTAIIGLIVAICRPLNENTKAMTKLTLNIESLSNKIEEQNKRIEQHERELSKYKEHVSESQKRQWDAIDENKDIIVKTKHDLELCQQKNKKGGM